MEWKQSKLFKEDFIVVGKWRLDVAYLFPHVKYLGADTETKLYYQGQLLSEEDAYNLYKVKGQAWCKQNIEVKAYAFMLADGENFALFQNAEDFLTACAMFNVNTVFWYNAKFDFAIFDYYMLSNDWHDITEEVAEKKTYGKMPAHTFQSLNGDFGQRYQMTIWQEYVNRQNQKKVHRFKMVDVCNIFGGGLAKNLKDWNIKDKDGNDVRKLEMDYVEADIEQDLQYMINDTKGLYLLAEAIDKTIKDITGFSLFAGDFMTAGGLAKKTLLKIMFHQMTPKDNIKAFKLCFPLTPEQDADFRFKHLYLGGKCFVNPYKTGIVQQNIFKYDVNSMYPNQMRNMAYPFGVPKKVHSFNNLDDKHVYIVCLRNLFGTLKYNMIPIWQDAITGDYVDVIREVDTRYIWFEELREIEKWYNLEYDLQYILEYEARFPKGAKEYVDKFYKIKGTSKGAVKQGAKLLLNSAYGKLAQKIERQICVYELGEDGCVHLVKKGTEVDEKSMLSVVVGSRITALARVHLMTLIRLSTNNDVKNNFCYCDTDSVHSLCKFDNPQYVDDKELGKLKCEGIYDYALYLAPKTYMLYNAEEGYEVHCKGVNTKVVKAEVENCKDFTEACNVFRPNRLFKCLCGLNVKGGKALIYVDKMILNDENIEKIKKNMGDLEEIFDDTIDNLFE